MNQKMLEIWQAVKDGKIDKDTARVKLTQSGAVGTSFPVRLTVRSTKPGEKPGWSEQNNFKLRRNEVTFRI